MLHLSLEDLGRIHQLGNLLPFESTPYDAQEMARSAVLLTMANRPEGWKLLDAAAYAAFMHDQVQPCVDEMAGTILRSRVVAMEKALDARKSAAGPLSLEQDLPDYFGPILTKAAKHQALVREAGLWCAVERFRYKFDRIPDRLEELVPEFIDKLPNDPVNGLPLRYVRKGKSDYLLYSMGWNGTDDGGVERRSNENGDWVWASDPRLIKNPDEESERRMRPRMPRGSLSRARRPESAMRSSRRGRRRRRSGMPSGRKRWRNEMPSLGRRSRSISERGRRRRRVRARSRMG